MGVEGSWEEVMYCPECKKDTTFFMSECDCDEGIVKGATCDVCEVEMEEVTKWEVVDSPHRREHLCKECDGTGKDRLYGGLK